MLSRPRLEEDRPVITNIALQRRLQEQYEENVDPQACVVSFPRRGELTEYTMDVLTLLPISKHLIATSCTRSLMSFVLIPISFAYSSKR